MLAIDLELKNSFDLKGKEITGLRVIFMYYQQNVKLMYNKNKTNIKNDLKSFYKAYELHVSICSPSFVFSSSE